MFSVACLLATILGGTVARAAVHPPIDSLKKDISRLLTRVAQREVRVCPVSVSSLVVKGGTVRITASIAMSYGPYYGINRDVVLSGARGSTLGAL